MIRRIFVYFAIIFLTIYCYFLYDHAIVTVMLVMEIIYFIFALFSVTYLWTKTKFSLMPMPTLAEKNQKLTACVQVTNHSKFPVVHFETILRMENTFTGEKKRIKVGGTVGIRGRKNVMIPIKVNACGNIIITLEKGRVFDVLYALRMNQKNGQRVTIGILPECYLIPLEISKKTRDFIADAEEYSDSEKGDDPSEICQIREYRETDSIHDIHWKLSAKSDELLVKEHGKPLGCVVLIWLDFSAKGKSDKLFGNKRTIQALELAASLSLSLLEEKCVHMVAWYEQENGTVYKKCVCKREHIYELLHRLLYIKPYMEREEMQIKYEEAFRGENFSTIVKVGADGSVMMNDKSVEIPMGKETIKWKELLLEL